MRRCFGKINKWFDDLLYNIWWSSFNLFRLNKHNTFIFDNIRLENSSGMEKKNSRNRFIAFENAIWETRRKERSDTRVVAHEGTFTAIEPEEEETATSLQLFDCNSRRDALSRALALIWALVRDDLFSRAPDERYYINRHPQPSSNVPSRHCPFPLRCSFECRVESEAGTSNRTIHAKLYLRRSLSSK